MEIGQMLPDEKTELFLCLTLDKIYENHERWTDLASILQKEIALIPYQDEKITCIYRLGNVFQRDLMETDLAIENFKEILNIDPNYEHALVALGNIYQDRAEWENLFEIRQRQADIEMDEENKSELLAEMAHIADEMLDKTQDAIGLWNQVLEIRGDDIESLISLKGLFEKESQWRDYVETCERMINILEDHPDEQVELYKELGRVWKEKLERDIDSLECWQKVLNLSPSDLDALLALKELYRASHEYEELVDIIEQLIEISFEDPDVLKALYTELGQIKTEIMMQPEEAIDAWQRVLSIDPDDFKAIVALESLYKEQGMWAECVDIIERKLHHLEEQDQIIQSLMAMGMIWEEQMANIEQAAAIYERILEVEPSNIEASQLLERIYQEQLNWRSLTDLWLNRIEFIEHKDERVDLLHQISRVYEDQVDSPEGAYLAMQKAFEEDYNNQITISELERLAEITEQWQELIDLYESVIQELPDAEAIELLIKIAEFYEQKLDQDVYALAYYKKVLEKDTENVQAIEALERIYEKLEKYNELVDAISRHAALSQDYDERIQLYQRLGTIQEEFLSAPENAIEAHKQILQIDEFDAEALAALERLYEQQNNWIELIDILSRQVSNKPDAANDIKLRIGEIWEEQVGSADRAIETYRDIVTFDPMNRSALDALERLYKKQQNWRELLEIYEKQMDIIDTDMERIPLQKNIAKLWEDEFGSKDNAIENYQNIIYADPNDEEAIAELERLFFETSRWEDLINTYRMHVDVVVDVENKVELYLKIGEVYDEKLEDIDQAIDAFTSVTHFDENNLMALQRLADLYEKAHDWDRCLQILEQFIHTTDDVSHRLNIYCRMGRIYDKELMDNDQAEQQYQFALSLEPFYEPAIIALKNIYDDREDWTQLLKMLKLQEEMTTQDERKADVLYQIARVCEEKLNDLTNAVDYYEKTLEYVPNHKEAAKPLIAMYFREKKWERAEPLLDRLVSQVDPTADLDELCELNFKLGIAAENLTNEEKALKYYKLAHEYEPNHLPTLKGLARLNLQREYWDLASRNYQNILVSHREKLEPEDLTEIYHNLGKISIKLGDNRKAINYLERVLEYDTDHDRTLQLLIALHESLNEWRKVIKYKQDLADVKDDALEEYTILVSVGDIYRERLRDRDSAIATYLNALDKKPDSKVIMVKLLEIYIESRNFNSAIDLLHQLTEIEDHPQKLAQYYYTIAAIYRDELKEPESAISYYNKTLDVDETRLKAFEAIDRLLTKQKDWDGLERNYHQMIKRVRDKKELADLLYMLYKNLGEIYRTRMRRMEDAVGCFELASRTKADDVQIHEMLSQMYELNMDSYDKAILQHRKLLLLKPDRVESYKSLRKLFMDMGQYDKAWCVCSVLTLLNKAGPDEKQFFMDHRQNTLPRTTRPLNSELWKRLYAQDLDTFMSQIFNIVYSSVGKAYASTPKSYGMKKKNRLDLNDKMMICHVFKMVSGILNMQIRELYRRDDEQGFNIYFTDPQSIFVGHDMLQGKTEKELGFLIGKHLTYLHPNFYLAAVFPHSMLKTALIAALKVCDPSISVKVDDKQLGDVFNNLNKMMPPNKRAELEQIVTAFRSSGREIHLNKWKGNVELTANHAGFLVCNDIQVAIKMIKAQTKPMSNISVTDKIKDLAIFTISDAFFKLRESLGIAIK